MNGGALVSTKVAATLHDTSAPPFMHGYTYSGHPTGCAVALAMLDLIEKEEFLAQAEEKGGRIMSALQSALGNHPHVGDIRGVGLMIGIEYMADKATKKAFAPADGVGAKVLAACMERGMVTRVKGDIFNIAPPIIVSDSSIDRIVETTVQATEEVLGE